MDRIQIYFDNKIVPNNQGINAIKVLVNAVRVGDILSYPRPLFGGSFAGSVVAELAFVGVTLSRDLQVLTPLLKFTRLTVHLTAS